MWFISTVHTEKDARIRCDSIEKGKKNEHKKTEHDKKKPTKQNFRFFVFTKYMVCVCARCSSVAAAAAIGVVVGIIIFAISILNCIRWFIYPSLVYGSCRNNNTPIYTLTHSQSVVHSQSLEKWEYECAGPMKFKLCHVSYWFCRCRALESNMPTNMQILTWTESNAIDADL